MKKLSFFVAFAALVACVGITSCETNENPATEQPDQDFYTVSLGWDGEILDTWYEPMRANSTDDLYGIQVYSIPDNGEQVEWERYAHGLFDKTGDITIKLLKGYKYKFEAQMVVDGKNKIVNSDGYCSAPFNGELTNQFNYSNQYNRLNITLGNRAPGIESFYGKLEDYTPGANGEKVKINMKRASFGAKFIAKGKLANSGTLHINMDEIPEMSINLSNGDKQISEIFTFRHVDGVWENNQYSETIAVTFNWIRTDGTTLPLGTHDVTYKRNATTVVNINIENDGNDNGIGFEYSDEDLGEMPEDGENDLTITDGEVVDTEVETNK